MVHSTAAADPKRPFADQHKFLEIRMRIRRLNIVTFVLLIAIPASSLVADPYIRDVASIEAAKNYREESESNNYSLRDRLVEIDSEFLQTTLRDNAGSNSTNSPTTIELQLFDDVLLIVDVLSYRNNAFRFFVKAGNSNCNRRVDEEGSNGILRFTELGHVVAKFEVCDEIYTIAPTRDLQIPYHFVRQWDQNNLPNID